MIKLKAYLAAALVLAVSAIPAQAMDRLTLQVGYGAGGGYDTESRIVANHLGRHLPGNPEIIVQNVPGAGSLKLLKQYVATGATDGSQIITVSSSNVQAPILSPKSLGFDPRNLKFLASLDNSPAYCIASTVSGITTLEQFLDSEIKLGATGKTSTTYVHSAAIRGALKTKSDIVLGFKGTAEIGTAMERGDVQGLCGVGINSADRFVRDGVGVIVAEVGLAPAGHAEFLLDAVADPEARQALEFVFSSNAIHKPMIAHPDTPDEIVTTLRAAFAALAQDEAFLAEVAERKRIINFTSGDRVQEIVNQTLEVDPVLAGKIRSYVQ